jgi:hypothetical protein
VPGPRSIRRGLAAVVAASGVLALAACSSLAPRPATTPVAIPTTASTAAPGSTVPLRTPVTIPVRHLQDRVPLGVAVLAAFSADPSYWDQVPNGKDFTGLTPVWVVVQYRWPSVQVTPQIELDPVTSDGSTAKPLVTKLIGGSPRCGIRLEDSRDIVPTGMECELLAMRHPKALTALEYRGSLITDVIAPDPAKEPDVRSPVRWSVPGGAKPVPAGAAHPED